jgi:pyruvate kinase
VPTERDLDDVAFGVDKGVDWIAMSFVRNAGDILRLRKALDDLDSDVPIIVKVEKREALESIEDLLREADGVMIARGDLGLDVPIEKVPFIQKDLVSKALDAVVPSIVATQMLESMMSNPRPTRAEVTDVFNAVLDGADALMLSGETAAGAYPIEAVRTMAQTALEGEARIDYEEQFRTTLRRHDRSIPEAVANSAVRMAIATGSKVIICCTRSGATAGFVSNNRPPAKIAVVGSHHDALRRSMLLWHTHPIKIPHTDDTDTMLTDAKSAVLESGIAAAGDRVVIVAGVPVGVPGTTNMIKSDVL